MATYAIGDIHGCYQALSTLIEAVNPGPNDVVITLGDHVDRGPDAKSCIEQLIDLANHTQLVTLRGNHEVMMMAARKKFGDRRMWLSVGGREVLESYGVTKLKDIPEEHWQFIDETQPYYQTDTHIFVHAGLHPLAPLEHQSDADLYWRHFDNPPPHKSGKTMVCGHSAQESGVPLSIGHAICIDTYAYGGQWLTCLDVDSQHYVQANESGDIRSDVLLQVD